MKHLLDIKDLSKKDVLNICNVAKKIKTGKLNLNLKELSVCNIFNEPSTRTFMSFKVAQNKLGMQTYDLISQMSSLSKGESLFDTVEIMKTYGINNFVIRDKNDFFFKKLLKIPNINLVNAGSGCYQHPTQALLNILTLLEKFNFNLENKKILFIGDLKYSRVFKSDLDILKLFNAKFYCCCCKDFLFENENIENISNISDIISEIDICYAYRLQHERHETKFFNTEFNQNYGLNEQNIKKTKKSFVFMHPGPVNYGVEIEKNLKNNSKNLILKQVENGVYIRMAILAIINKKGEI